MELRTQNTERATKVDSNMSYRRVKDMGVYNLSFITDKIFGAIYQALIGQGNDLSP